MNLIASLKHTNRYHEHIVFWHHDSKGYTPVAGDAGHYGDAEWALHLNDGESCLAIPVSAVMALTVPTPLRRDDSQFYDIAGPVVENTRANWNALIGASLAAGRREGVKVKPEIFRGTRRTVPAAPAEAVA